MKKLDPTDLWSLEKYAEERAAFRAKVLAHKQPRKLHIGPNMTLLFEDQLTVQYQVQEMLRIERLFEKPAIQDELDAYNPLIPDGSNWKATCLIEYEDAAERAQSLRALRNIERQVWAQAGSEPRILAIADEDLDRSDEEKTSAVHFLRFELPRAAVAALKGGAGLSFGVDHPAYTHSVNASEATRASLLADLL
ncbi:MAG TPA: DUF3501 family protein [Solimonas sp.]|nr:DUF3501 family protein [Solimonas sp.]